MAEFENLKATFQLMATGLDQFAEAMAKCIASLSEFKRELEWMMYVHNTQRSALSEALKPW